MATVLTSPASPAGLAHSRPAYAELKRRVRDAGLLDLRPRYYALKALLTVGAYAGTITLAFVVSGWWSLLVAAGLGALFTQVGLLGHDLQHRQIVRNRRVITVTGIILGNLLLGVSYTWWSTKHNAHHATPNQEGADPDIDFPMLAFSEAQAVERRRFWRPVAAYQAFLFLPLTALQALNTQIIAFQHVIGQRPPHRTWEAAALVAHAAGYAVLLVYLGWPIALGFFAVQMAVSGIYNGMVFAPNHKGMPVLEADNDLDFLHRQVLTSRNVRRHPLTDFAYGGLNYQVEHHLFPTMPRCNLRRAQPIVRAFCAEHGLPYAEETPFGSLRAILSSLHQASAPLRA